MNKIKTITDVVDWRLCLGCGACLPACPENAIKLVDVETQGIRPFVTSTDCTSCAKCLEVCPGISISHSTRFSEETVPELRTSWGPVLEVWEGYASDPELRFKGSSGGVISALSLFSLEIEKMTGVLHTGNDPKFPLKNIPVYSRNRDDLLSCTGSRYSPAAPCEKFDWIEKEQGSSVFIGKPCDVVALRKYQKINSQLDEKVGLVLTFFCAGTPSTQGTQEILKQFGVEPNEVKNFRYRGNGWPGMTTATLKGNEGSVRQMSYEESWGKILSGHVQHRCKLCPDSTGEFADISCCDAWYRPFDVDNPGQSLVLVRTERGREVLHKAIEAGYVHLERADSFKVAASQKSLLQRRRHLWGRLGAMRVMGVPVPRYEGFSLLRNWMGLTLKEKIYSVGGTFVRIVQRKWTKPMVMDIKTGSSSSSLYSITRDP